MKQVAIASVLTCVLAGYAHAGVIYSSAANNTPYETTNETKFTTPRRQAYKHPSQWYAGINGGYNINFGTISSNLYPNSGLNFHTSSATIGGYVGIDFNDPKWRLELEAQHAAKGTHKWEDTFKDSLHSEMDYTSIMLNAIPYFSLNNQTVNLNLIFGAGAALVSFKDTDDDDSLYINSSKAAFAITLGISLDVKIDEDIYFVPEIKNTLLITGSDIMACAAGYCADADSTLYSNNLQFLAGIRFKF